MMLKGYFTEHRRLWLGLCSLFFLIAAWELVLTYIFPVNPFFFTKPSLIAAAFKEQIQGAKLWHDLAVSSQAFIWGFSFAVIVGIPVGLVMGWRRRVEYSLDPFLTALYASPLVALAPLFIIVFGVGVLGKAALVFLAGGFSFHLQRIRRGKVDGLAADQCDPILRRHREGSLLKSHTAEHHAVHHRRSTTRHWPRPGGNYRRRVLRRVRRYRFRHHAGGRHLPATGHVRRHHHPVSHRRRADRTHAQTGAYGRAVARD